MRETWKAPIGTIEAAEEATAIEKGAAPNG
jgi:hypothetical protein